MLIKTDCKYYTGFKPCKFHKTDKRLCEGCDDYKQIKTRILIIKLDALGDVLRTTSILPALRNKYPDPHITWITKSEAANLLKSNEMIDRILQFEKNYISYILNEEFDLGICLDADSSSATILSVAKCKEKKGFISDKHGRLTIANPEAEKWYNMGLNDDLKTKNRETYQTIIYGICGLDNKLIYRPQITLRDEALKYADEFKRKNKLDGKFVIGINTGGGSRWECKKWKREYYVELIKMLGNINKHIAVILFGGENEKELKGYIKENCKNIMDAECHDSVNKFAGIINLVDIFLTPDSLGFHISAALEKYTLVLVGPTSPHELDVYGKGEIIYNETLDCIACYDSVCKRNKECMSTLTPELIYTKIIKRIEEVSNS